MLSTRTPGRKADQVSEDLLRRIVAGELPVDTILPREKDLATEYGVNRGVIREAIKLLEVHRLVRPVRRRGTVVLNPMTSLSPEVIRAMLQPKPGQIDVNVFADLLEIRTQLDIQMSTLAAERRDESDLEALRACRNGVARSLTGVEDFSRSLSDFAMAIAQATHNRIFPMLVSWDERVRQDLGDLMLVVRQPNEHLVQGIDYLISLISERDVDAVRSVVVAYHEWARPELLKAAVEQSRGIVEEEVK